MIKKHAAWTLSEIVNSLVKKESGCWEWPYEVNDRGYGQVWMVGEYWRQRVVHRVVYEDAKRMPVEKGWHLHHECHNRRCANPDHLTPMTQWQHKKLHKALREQARRKALTEPNE